uniref:Uncharacterized protein n=1 Tax=Arundo donax TaxID=35708 RepID=A0A0A8YNF0_ARUDO
MFCCCKRDKLSCVCACTCHSICWRRYNDFQQSLCRYTGGSSFGFPIPRCGYYSDLVLVPAMWHPTDSMMTCQRFSDMILYAFH